MSDLYPNVYRITYKEYVGDNRSGSVVEKVTCIEDITLLRHYRSKIIQIVPISATFLPELSSQGVEQLFEMLDSIAAKEKHDHEIENEIKTAEAALARLKELRNE